MPLIEYPSSLPPPAGYPFAPRERRAVPQGAGNEETRARARDAIVDAQTVRWRYSPEEMAIWREWFQDTLLEGQLWFSATLPGRGGWATRVARYIGEQLQLTHLGAGCWEVSCRLELRGLSAQPYIRPMPVLLMHFDDDFVDATEVSTFAPAGTYSFTDAELSAFGRSVVGISIGRAVATSSRDLAIGTQRFTIEGRSRFATDEGGGVVVAKNYWDSQPDPGVYKDDFDVTVGPGGFSIGWTGQALERGVIFAEIRDQEFTWSISDDGEHCYMHLNGELVGTEDACALDAVPPPTTAGSSISVLNKLQGFAGESPNWSANFYVGRLDELRMFIGTALYGAEDYTPSVEPFTYP